MVIMPKKGQKSITINEKTWNIAKGLATKEEKSVSGFVTDLIIENAMEVPADG